VTSVLLLTGGSPHAHDFDAIGDALDDALAEGGHDVIRVGHPDAAADMLAGGDIDVLVVHGLWWRMLDDVYEPWREFAYSTPLSTRATFDGFVRGGGGLVALHTAPICFDDWPGWGDVVGGAWRWGVSSHPPLGPVSGRIITDHPVVDGLSATIELVDEVYGDLDVRDGVEPLAVARRNELDAEQPVVWTYRCGDGRVVFDGFGHDPASIAHVDNRTMILQAVDWVAPRCSTAPPVARGGVR
jgi:hypothetical protein